MLIAWNTQYTLEKFILFLKIHGAVKIRSIVIIGHKATSLSLSSIWDCLIHFSGPLTRRVIRCYFIKYDTWFSLVSPLEVICYWTLCCYTFCSSNCLFYLVIFKILRILVSFWFFGFCTIWLLTNFSLMFKSSKNPYISKETPLRREASWYGSSMATLRGIKGRVAEEAEAEGSCHREDTSHP